MIAPTLHTDRLTLRPLEVRDFDAYADMFASDRAQFMGKLDRLQAWYCFGADIASWPLFGVGHWAIDRDDTLIGEIGFQKPVNYPETEFGWVLFDGFEGQGYATEAARGILQHARQTLGIQRLVCLIEPDNAGSVRVAEKIGMQYERSGEDQIGPYDLYTNLPNHIAT